MGKLFISEHPLIQHKMAMLRDKNTSTKEFRELVNEITKLLTYEATRELPVEDTTVETPVAEAQCKKITKDIVVVPILRAGLGMVDGFHDLIPSSKIGHIGLYRDPDTPRSARNSIFSSLSSSEISSSIWAQSTNTSEPSFAAYSRTA